MWFICVKLILGQPLCKSHISGLEPLFDLSQICHSLCFVLVLGFELLGFVLGRQVFTP
jgi:hypothetical protein